MNHNEYNFYDYINPGMHMTKKFEITFETN